ncbi:MAG: two-component system response regulator [Desulfitibacter sp. BRH_c19]|nr:MAG: two-component system response regulator [Desulfitibacter sp. BRH_c19]
MVNIKHRILVVEDEEKILRFIKANLLVSNYDVSMAKNGKDALESYEKHLPDIVLLDIMLPKLNGFEVLKKIREFSDVPIILLTAKGSSVDIVKGLELGADDYVTKPFEINELLARIKAVLRRVKDDMMMVDNEIIIGNLVINFLKHEVFVDEKNVKLTSTEHKILGELAKNKGCVMTHEELLTKIWGHEYREETHYLRVAIAKIRQKIGIIEDKSGYIQTVPTVGYKLIDRC